MAVTSSGTATVTLPTDEQILITREFDAPRHLVYRAWTTPELVKRWWHAKRGTMTVAEIDLRVGGRWRYAMVDGRRLRGRLPRRVPRDRPERAARLDRGVRGHPRRRGACGADHPHAHRGGRPDDPHGPRRASDQGRPRRTHRLRDGARHAGCDGSPGGGRCLASLSGRRGVAPAGSHPATAKHQQGRTPRQRTQSRSFDRRLTAVRTPRAPRRRGR